MKYRLVNSLSTVISSTDIKKERALANTSNQDIENLLILMKKKIRSANKKFDRGDSCRDAGECMEAQGLATAYKLVIKELMKIKGR